jgi:hypothetical protein
MKFSMHSMSASLRTWFHSLRLMNDARMFFPLPVALYVKPPQAETGDYLESEIM